MCVSVFGRGEGGQVVSHGIKNHKVGNLARWLSWLEPPPLHQRVAVGFLVRAQNLGCGFDPWSGRAGEAIKISLPLSNINKHILR